MLEVAGALLNEIAKTLTSRNLTVRQVFATDDVVKVVEDEQTAIEVIRLEDF